MKPSVKPQNPRFSSGPTTKYPGWNLSDLDHALLGRSHRSTEGKARIKQVIDKIKTLLEVPDDYHVGILPASDTGAVETALWTMLGPRPVDVFAWEVFGGLWVFDTLESLKIENARSFVANYGQLPDLSQANMSHDIIFTWNGTTAGVKVPNGDWIADDREGLTICDATSAVFAMEMPWEKLDVTTFSWQKVLGGEAQHGVMILSPRAVERLENHTPSWPIPKIFRLTKNGKFNQSIFEGNVINTPSMLCFEDVLAALNWVEKIGGQKETIRRSMENLDVVKQWVDKTPWAEFLCQDDACLSNTSLCISVTAPWFDALDLDEQNKVIQQMTDMIAQEDVGYDFKGHRDAPPGLRIWGGSTVESEDIQKLLPWVEWAYETVQQSYQEKAA